MSSMNKDLLELDIYEILGLSIEATEKEIRKAFRKKALDCHPDKNPDNPNAAKEFNRLKTILEILLDSGARSAYDKVLKGRKAAAQRARESNLKSQKLKSELELREKLSSEKSQLSEEERLRREIKRLEEEGRKLIEEEIEIVNKEAENQLRESAGRYNERSSSPSQCRVKAKWYSNEEWLGYTKEEIERIFFKWGEISAVVMQKKGLKNTALIEYEAKSAADMAVQFEKGLPGKQIEVSSCTRSLKKKSKKKDREPVPFSSRDFESIADMNERRKAERKRLIEEMLANDDPP